MAASQYQIPATPRVISPSPTPSEHGNASGSEGYFGPVTRSISRATKINSPEPIDEENDSSGSDPEKRARSRSREVLSGRRRTMSGLTGMTGLDGTNGSSGKATKRKPESLKVNGQVNGHLSPNQANRNYWRELSRSPSPLGLIPIHQEWRSFIHRHEIPRKILHVSIGFLTLYLYSNTTQPSSIHPILLSLLLPISLTDFLRHRSWRLNRLYIRLLGALMRESEVDGWNGVIWYLLGTWLVLRWFPKDIGVVSVLLLSWCDTAASTAGRRWGRYTFKVRRGKSFAGSLAAAVTGVATAAMFWGYVAPLVESGHPGLNSGENAFAFQGRLGLPESVRQYLGISVAKSFITGPVALGVMSVWSGLVASVSEAIDLWGYDDNLTIPVLCGVGLWGFLKVFG